MNSEVFRKYLLEKGVNEDEVLKFITQLEAFQGFLERSNSTIDAVPNGKILEYTEDLVKTNREGVLEFLRGLINYANFTKQFDSIIEVIEIAEAFNAMENLSQRIGEQYGEAVQNDIFAGISLPPLGTNPEPKSEVTKVVMKRLEEKLGEEKTIELLAPCLHGRPLEPSQKDRAELLRLKNIDRFLDFKHQERLKQLQQHHKNGTLEYAQYVDEEVVEYVKNTLTLSPGKREGNKIISTKMPYQTKKYLNAEDDRMKRYYYCYCPWVRGAIKKGEEHEISANFCHCSAGFTKKYWDVVFDQPTTVEPIATVLRGSLECKFAVHIPENALNNKRPSPSKKKD